MYVMLDSCFVPCWTHQQRWTEPAPSGLIISIQNLRPQRDICLSFQIYPEREPTPKVLKYQNFCCIDRK